MDCLTDLAKEAVMKLGDLVVESTIRHFKYLIQHKKLTTNLNEELENLKRMKQALQARVDIETRKGHEIAPNLQKWLSDVANIENELQSFYQIEVNKNNKKCLDLALNYSLGKQATEKTQEITSLKEDGNKIQTIFYPKAPPTYGSTLTKGIKSLMSRNKVITQVIEKLKDDQVKIVSICGMGGLGKTTMAKQVIEIIQKSNIFDEIAMAVVSQTINYEKIQTEIAERLGMERENKSIPERAMKLQERLSKSNKRVLIVLDDVWDVLDFECIGIPSLKQEEKGQCCKILLTSRDVKKCLEMGSKVNFEVPALSEDEALSLFEEIAGEVVKKPDIRQKAKQVAKECKGLPLAIVTVGKALENERMFAWEEALRQLRNSELSDVGNKVYQSIKLSFNALDSKEQKCFLILCGLFPEDFDIPIETLLRHAMGLGLFKNIGASWTARNRVQVLVSNLKRKFLLLDSNVPGCVKMHDIIRDVIISDQFQMQQQELRVAVLDDIKRLKQGISNGFNAISLILDDDTTAIELENGLDCSTLQLLQVRSKNNELIIWPQLVFQSTSALQVFSVKNMCIPKFPCLSQAPLLHLQALLMEHCDLRGDISVIGKELIHLQVLSFAHSIIKKLPTEIGNLVSLRLLDLTKCNDLCFISSNVFMRLTQLEELYFWIDNFPWNMNDDMINELQHMSHQLKVVEIKVRGTEMVAKRLDFRNLEKFWVYISPDTHFQRSAYLESNILQVGAIDYKSVKNMLMVSQLIDKCEILAIKDVKDLKSVISQLYDHQLVYLKDLSVEACPNLEYLIDSTKDCNAFPQIQKLSLKRLDNLKEICYTPNQDDIEISMNGFTELQTLELIYLPNFIGFSKAGNLNELHQVQRISSVETELVTESTSSMNAKLFSFEWIQQFPKLETISIQDCPLIDLVFDMQGYSQLDGQVFSALEKIDICYLDKLTCIWSKAIHGVQGFQNLKSLKILSCPSLRYVFTPAIVKTILKFEKLEILSCELLEFLVIDNEDGELEFPSLGHMEIVYCPKLDISRLQTTYKKKNNLSIPYYSNTSDNFKETYSTSSNTHLGCTPLCSKLILQSNTNKKNNKVSKTKKINEVEVVKVCAPLVDNLFPKLKVLKIGSCDKGSVLLSPSSSRCLVCLEMLDIWYCKNLEEIVSQEEREENTNKIMFPALNHLSFWKLPKLKAFYRGSNELDFPSLQNVNIQYCPDMEVFSKGSSHTHKLEDVKIELEYLNSHYIQNKDLNAIIQTFKTLVSSKGSKTLSWNMLHTKNLKINISEFHELSVLVPFNELKMIQHLRDLGVSKCESLVEVFESVSTIKREDTIHYELQQMSLHSLPKLSHIWKHNNNMVSFRKLASINVSYCHSLKSLISHSMARSLDQLKEITVEDCDMMEEIVTKKDTEESGEGEKKHKILFPKLNTVKLSNLPNLECFCSGYFDYDIPLCHVNNVEEDTKMSHNNNDDTVQISFPQLKSFSFIKVPKLKCFCPGEFDYNIIDQYSSTQEDPNILTFPLKTKNVIVNTPNLHDLRHDEGYIDGGDLSLTWTMHYITNSDKYKAELRKLTTFIGIDQNEALYSYIKRTRNLNINKCHKLLNCIPTNIKLLFSHVNQLIVEECECLEEIFESSSNDTMVSKHIPKTHPHILGLQNLKKLKIYQCHKLKYVFPDVSLVTGLPFLRILRVRECNKMEEIIMSPSSIQEQPHEGKIIFQGLERVVLDHLHSLKWFYRSSSPCYVVFQELFNARIRDCPEMNTFWYNGTVYLPKLPYWLKPMLEFSNNQRLS